MGKLLKNKISRHWISNSQTNPRRLDSSFYANFIGLN
jgi:hypothetical protein